jgi:hypothetical protein
MRLCEEVSRAKLPDSKTHPAVHSATIPASDAESMSALGHKRTFRSAITMSALPPKADMCSATRYVRFVPIADIAALFDHLVGACKQRRRYGEDKRLGSADVDHQFVLGRRLDRQVGRLLALEDAALLGGFAVAGGLRWDFAKLTSERISPRYISESI